MAARGAALSILQAVRKGRRFDDALDEFLTSLPDADRRLAHEIAAGILRTRDTLDQIVSGAVTASFGRVPADTRDILRIGAYQLLHLQRVPDHAAVATSVELARELNGERAAGFVNAVLRRVAGGRTRRHDSEEGGKVRQSTAERLAREYSHPEWLVTRWLRHFGPERTHALLEHNNRRPSVVIRPARWTAEQLGEALGQAGIRFAEAPWAAGFAVSGVPIRKLPGYNEGGFVVQDPAQARVLDLVEAPEDGLIWDACAAPGGKAAMLGQRFRVIAGDRSKGRVSRLAETIGRAAPAVRVFAADALAAPLRPGSVDVVLLDAPCSATGTFARHPDARWRIEPSHLTRLGTQQAALLDAVADVVRVGGRVVYITCSLEPEENETQVDRFLERQPAFRRYDGDVFVFPPDAGTDGAFAARLERTG